jgi:hypothetical protein
LSIFLIHLYFSQDKNMKEGIKTAEERVSGVSVERVKRLTDKRM